MNNTLIDGSKSSGTLSSDSAHMLERYLTRPGKIKAQNLIRLVVKIWALITGRCTHGDALYDNADNTRPRDRHSATCGRSLVFSTLSRAVRVCAEAAAFANSTWI
jgi:hypothetical protein